MKFEGEHYVVVAEFDSTEEQTKRWNFQRGGPLVYEVYLGESTDRKAAEKRAASLGTAYGRTRIARLVFEDDTNNKQGESQ